VVGANPDQPMPITPTRGNTRPLYRGPVGSVLWTPAPEYVEGANVTRFMRAHGIGDYDELVRRSVADIEWFWDAVVRDLDIGFLEPYDRVLDDSVRAKRYELDFVQVGDKVRLRAARWTQQCWPGRGHQDFSIELCV